ncbi:MAG: AEC family transporter [Pseudomonadota bacterium]
MPQAVIDVVLPLFGIILAGYLAGLMRLFGPTSSEILNRFVFSVALPALVFISLAKVSIEEFFNWPFLTVLVGGMLATFCTSLLVARIFFPGSLTALTFHALTAMFSSTGYIGIPLVAIAFGDEALVFGIIGTIVTGVVFFTLAIIIAEVDRSRETGKLMLAPMTSVIRNPVVIATVAGLTVSALDIPVPKPFSVFCELLGGAFIPCALFSAGLFMVGWSIKGDARELSWLVFAKLALQPLLTWWLAFHVVELDGSQKVIAVLLAALPTGAPVFVLAQKYGVFAALATATVVVTTVVSVVTLTLILAFLS